MFCDHGCGDTYTARIDSPLEQIWCGNGETSRHRHSSSGGASKQYAGARKDTSSRRHRLPHRATTSAGSPGTSERGE
nr:unnamed protein product [Digitaria exilis]